MDAINLYHVAHICKCGKLCSHSQGEFDDHLKYCEFISFPTEEYYNEGDTAAIVFDRLIAYGAINLDNPAWEKVYMYFANERRD